MSRSQMARMASSATLGSASRMKSATLGLFMRRSATTAARRTAADGLLESDATTLGVGERCCSAKAPAWRSRGSRLSFSAIMSQMGPKRPIILRFSGEHGGEVADAWRRVREQRRERQGRVALGGIGERAQCLAADFLVLVVDQGEELGFGIDADFFRGDVAEFADGKWRGAAAGEDAEAPDAVDPGHVIRRKWRHPRSA